MIKIKSTSLDGRIHRDHGVIISVQQNTELLLPITQEVIVFINLQRRVDLLGFVLILFPWISLDDISTFVTPIAKISGRHPGSQLGNR